MTGMPGIKSDLLTIGGPPGVNCIRTTGIGKLHQVSSVRIAHPYFPGPPATGGKGDVPTIRRVLWNILAACGGNQLYGGSFRVRQILAPDVDVMGGCEYKRELVTFGRNRQPKCV